MPRGRKRIETPKENKMVSEPIEVKAVNADLSGNTDLQQYEVIYPFTFKGAFYSQGGKIQLSKEVYERLKAQNYVK